MDGSVAARLLIEQRAVNSEAVIQLAEDVARLAAYCASHTAQVQDREWLEAIAARWSKHG